MSILVVGSVAYDTVETPFGRAERVLGGSASFFSVAASFFAPVNLVGVVGHDFGEEQLAAFRGRPIDLEGLERMEGKTFHWQGKYSLDLNSRDTISHRPQRLRVLQAEDPRALPEARGRLPRQHRPRAPAPRPRAGREARLVACDTMNFWIHGKPGEVRKTLERGADPPRSTTRRRASSAGEWNLVKAARAIRAMGPRTLVVKKGEHGVLMFSEEGCFAAPALPLEVVFDPTGAGDTFAGGFLGYLASTGQEGDAALRRAVIMGSTLASFCVEAFSLDRLLNLTRPEIDERYRAFEKLTRFESL